MTYQRPQLLAQSVLATLAQLTQGIIGLGLLLVGHQHHLSVTTSALAVSGYALGMAVGRPLQGRALDTLTPRGVLAGCGLAHGAAYVLIALAAEQRWSVVFVATGALAGLALPPIATQMRADWPARADAGAPTRVFALITMLQTTSVLLGPLLFTVIDAVATPTVAMLTVAAVSVICTVLFGLAAHASAHEARSADRVPLRHYVALLVITGCLGAVTGTVEVTAPAVAIDAHRPGVAGPLVAIATVGTLIGGVLTMRSGRSSTRTHLLVGLVLQVVGASLLLLSAPLPVAAVGLLVMGGGFAPALAAASVLVSRRGGGTAESFGWQSTALGLGVASGSATAGALVGVGAHLSALPALIGAVLCGVAMAAVRVTGAQDEAPGQRPQLRARRQHAAADRAGE